MDGAFKLIVVFVFFISLSSCKKKEDIIVYSSKEIVRLNMPILLDSLDYFDWTKIPIPVKFKTTNRENFKVELLNSISYDKNISRICKNKFSEKFGNNTNFNFECFKMDDSFIKKSTLNNNLYEEINIVNKSSNDIYTLTVEFSNLLVDSSKNYLSIVVTKKIGIAMKKDIYFFKIKNKKYIYINRYNIAIS